MALPKWTDSLKILTTIAPALAAAAIGPLGSTAVTALESALGLQSSGDLPARQDAVSIAIAGSSPEMLLALKKADQDFQVRMTELGFADAEAIAKLVGDDRSSARQREQTVRDATPRTLAVAITLGFFAILFYMAFRSVPAPSKDILNIMVGSLGAAFISIVSYYFGSSTGSDRKTEILADQGK